MSRHTIVDVNDKMVSYPMSRNTQNLRVSKKSNAGYTCRKLARICIYFKLIRVLTFYLPTYMYKEFTHVYMYMLIWCVFPSIY